MIKTCPNCGQNYMVSFDTTDYVHDCGASPASAVLKNEDVVKTGDWEDSSGSGTIGAQAVMRQGAENLLQGTTAQLEGDDKEELTRRGARASTHRQRKHEEFIDFKKEKLKHIDMVLKGEI